MAQARQYALEFPDGVGLYNVRAEPATLQGKKGLRPTLSVETKRRLESMPPEERKQHRLEQLAWIKDLSFSSG